MLEARHSFFHKRLLFAYVDRRLRGAFHSISLHGAEGAEKGALPFPAVFFSNHETWWDGFLEIPIFRRYHLDYYIMMEERNLRRFRFFAQCGVFGVDLADRRGRAAGLLYAVRLLRAEGAMRRSLVLYPHGRLTPAAHGTIPPFEPGLGKLLELAPAATAVPVFKWIRFRKHPQPEVFIAFGSPLEPGGGRSDEALRAALENTRDSLFREVAHRDALADRGEPVAAPVWILSPPRRYRGQTD